MKAKLTPLASAFGLAAILTVSAFAQEKPAGLTPAEAKSIAQEGFVFGLPLVYIATQADAQANVPKPEAGRAPFNQFDHHRISRCREQQDRRDEC